MAWRGSEVTVLPEPTTATLAECVASVTGGPRADMLRMRRLPGGCGRRRSGHAIDMTTPQRRRGSRGPNGIWSWRGPGGAARGSSVASPGRTTRKPPPLVSYFRRRGAWGRCRGGRPQGRERGDAVRTSFSSLGVPARQPIRLTWAASRRGVEGPVRRKAPIWAAGSLGTGGRVGARDSRRRLFAAPGVTRAHATQKEQRQWSKSRGNHSSGTVAGARVTELTFRTPCEISRPTSSTGHASSTRPVRRRCYSATFSHNLRNARPHVPEVPVPRWKHGLGIRASTISQGDRIDLSLAQEHTSS